jgi:hypothetical protein
MSIVDFTKLIKALEDNTKRIQDLEKAKADGRLISLNVFLSRGYMSPASFYQKAPHGLISGAYKIGNRWFVDEAEFLKSVKC